MFSVAVKHPLWCQVAVSGWTYKFYAPALSAEHAAALKEEATRDGTISWLVREGAVVALTARAGIGKVSEKGGT